VGPARGEGRLANLSAALLVGGASRRMGRDKAHVPVAGEAGATRLARRLAALCDEVLLVGGHPPPDAPGRRVPDVEGPHCALRGLVGALAAAGAERVLVVATDLPLASEALWLALAAWPEADVVAPRDAEGPQPLCAVYRREPVLARARAQLAEGSRLALRDLLAGLEVRVLPDAVQRALDPDGSALTNVNTPEELARLEAYLAQRRSAAEKLVP
jgi:molybdopterin-guanine dinucleotide biosynthesis protein A